MQKNSIVLLSNFLTIFFSFLYLPSAIKGQSHIILPYQQAGLTERQAVAHILSRFTYGAVPGQIDSVIKVGLSNWVEQQLSGELPDDALNSRLDKYDALTMSNAQVSQSFAGAIQIIRMAKAEGIVPVDSANDDERRKYKQALKDFTKSKRIRQISELFLQFINQKILRAAYSSNQLREILTEFWFNHFNVSITKRDCAMFIPAYERDMIRPNVLGKFENLLIATAKSPAMLLYLDNASSSGENSMLNVLPKNSVKKDSVFNIILKLQRRKKNDGLNENYARELMELHTLGVDGGYTQKDVTEAARILTGWTNYPAENSGNILRNLIDNLTDQQLSGHGFAKENDFLFAVHRHDDKPKHVMGKAFNSNAGFGEGLGLLKMLSQHPSTAGFISRKIAVHFVADNPPQSIVDKMAKTYLSTQGNIRQVLITMISSPEFWNKNVIRGKTKSPFELVISAARALNTDLQQPGQLYRWAERMGQKLYYYPAPSGFPDEARYWINTGALLNRMNFGLAIASGKIRGLTFDLLKLNSNHEPESANEALIKYGQLLMPERDLESTIKRLNPFLSDPELEKKLQIASDKHAQVQWKNELLFKEGINENAEDKFSGKNKSFKYTLAQVVGILLGSPEFQRK